MRHRIFTNLTILFTLAAAAALAGCGMGSQSGQSASAVSVSPTKASAYVGNTVQFQGITNTSSTAPSGPITWTSSNTKVATVNSSTGLATAVGPGTVAIVASVNTSGSSQSASATLVVSGPLTVTTSSLPGGSVGQSYSATLQAAGGTPPYSWSITSGSLPAGLTLSSTGVISGTPTGSGTSTFVVQVKDSAGSTSSLVARMVEPRLIR